MQFSRTGILSLGECDYIDKAQAILETADITKFATDILETKKNLPKINILQNGFDYFPEGTSCEDEAYLKMLHVESLARGLEILDKIFRFNNLLNEDKDQRFKNNIPGIEIIKLQSFQDQLVAWLENILVRIRESIGADKKNRDIANDLLDFCEGLHFMEAMKSFVADCFSRQRTEQSSVAMDGQLEPAFTNS